MSGDETKGRDLSYGKNNLQVLRLRVFLNRSIPDSHGWIYEVASQLPTVKLLDFNFTEESVLAPTGGADFDVVLRSLAVLGGLRNIGGLVTRQVAATPLRPSLFASIFSAFPHLRALHLRISHRAVFETFQPPAHEYDTLVIGANLEVLSVVGNFGPTLDDDGGGNLDELSDDVRAFVDPIVDASIASGGKLKHLVLISTMKGASFGCDRSDYASELRCVLCNDKACEFVPSASRGMRRGIHEVVRAITEFVCDDRNSRKVSLQMP